MTENNMTKIARLVADPHADETAALRAELSEAYGYATRFLQAFCENNGLRQVKPLPTLCGVLTQIDNATTAPRARVAKLETALQEAREFIAKERIKADPQRETCSECQGSGYGGHPDSGALCVKCNGTGEVAALSETSKVLIKQLGNHVGDARMLDDMYGGSDD